MANFLTGLRILFSLLLLFCGTFSPPFYVFYLAAGVSDMLDGTVARVTHTASDFGAKFDTTADVVFCLTACVKIFPTFVFPVWLWVWISAIAVLKISTFVWGLRVKKTFVVHHSVMNKITGLLLFFLPFGFALSLPAVQSTTFVCIVASIAAVQENLCLTKKYNL